MRLIDITRKDFQSSLSNVMPYVNQLNRPSEVVVRSKIDIIANKLSTKELTKLVHDIQDGIHDYSTGWFNALLALDNANYFKFKNNNFSPIGSFIKSYSLCVFIGLVVVVAQFGGQISHFIPIHFARPLWTSSFLPFSMTSGSMIMLYACIFLLFLAVLKTYSDNYVEIGFIGVFVGFVAIPAATIALGASAAAIYLCYIVVSFLLAWLYGVVVWLAINIFAPFFHLILIPFTWFFKSVIYPVITFFYDLISPIFIWFYKTVIHPITSFLCDMLSPIYGFFVSICLFIAKYVLSPLLTVLMLLFEYIVYPILVSMYYIIYCFIFTIPLYAIGAVFKNSMLDSLRMYPSQSTVFCYGVGMGFMLFDLTANCILSSYGYSSSACLIVFLISFALGCTYISLLLYSKNRASHVELNAKYTLGVYIKRARLDIIVSMLLIPVGILVAIFMTSDDS